MDAMLSPSINPLTAGVDYILFLRGYYHITYQPLNM